VREMSRRHRCPNAGVRLDFRVLTISQLEWFTICIMFFFISNSYNVDELGMIRSSNAGYTEWTLNEVCDR
jgi:hypothetical protein